MPKSSSTVTAAVAVGNLVDSFYRTRWDVKRGIMGSSPNSP